MIKDALKITSPAQDPYMDLLPAAARDAVEMFTGRCIIRKTMGQMSDAADLGVVGEPWWNGMRQGAISAIFKSNAIVIENPPLVSVEEIYTYDIYDVETLFASTNYRVEAFDPNQYGKIVLKYGTIWPVMMREFSCLDIRYTAGYADGAVPPALVLAILKVAVWAYKNRAPCDESACCCALGSTIDAYRMMKVSVG